MSIQIIPVMGLPDIRQGDDLGGVLIAALGSTPLLGSDVLVVTQKIVSKAEGAVRLAADDAAYRAVVEDESRMVLRRRGDLVISVTSHGFICANAGVDRSNAEDRTVVLLPRDPDESARGLRASLQREFGVEVAVIITDTFGRAWRRGLVDVAIGVAGMRPILDLRGTPDASGRILEATEVAVVDELAAAAELVMGKAEGIPAAIVRGYAYEAGTGSITDLLRPPGEDLFR
ncbi:MAG TPA: coenzyme F420-0:L-glutamate ligase [Acidimicrobiia bacterium]